SSRAHRADIRPPNLVGGHLRNGNRGGINCLAAGKLPIELDGRHDHKPGNNSTGEKNSGNTRTDDVADSEILGGDCRAEGCSGKPAWTRFGLRGPRLNRVHQECVNATETKSPENSAGKRTASFAGDKNVSAGRSFRKRKVAVFLDDELAAQRNHEQNTQPSAKQREWKNSPEGEFFSEAEKNERGNREHYARGQ